MSLYPATLTKVNRPEKPGDDDTQLLKDFLNRLRNWMKDINEDRDEFVKTNTMRCRTKLLLDNISKLICSMDHAEHKEILARQAAQNQAGYTFTQYLMGLTNNGKNTPTSGYNYWCSEIVRIVCWNYSDASLEFCMELGRNGMFPLAVADLNNFLKEFDDTHIRGNIILPNLHILHNCAKSPDNKKYMKDAGVVGAIVPYTKVNESDLKMVAMLTLSYIIEEEHNYIISADRSMIKFILESMEDALMSKAHKYKGFSTHEIVAGLMHLASNDDNKATIVNEGILPMLLELMQTGDEHEKAVSAQTVWVLSFKQENKDKIRHEANMIETLENLSYSAGAASDNASGALWVLKSETGIQSLQNPHENGLLLVPPHLPSRNQDINKAGHRTSLRKSFVGQSAKYEGTADFREDISDTDVEFRSVPPGHDSPIAHIMLSYQWDCQELIQKIKRNLQLQNYKVWIDVEEMGGSILQCMADGVENSAVVLIAMSRKYKESPNCRTEAEYAFQLDKTVIPLRVEPMYKPDGWLGALLGAKYYFDFTNANTFENVFSNLLKEIEKRGEFSRTVDDITVPVSVTKTYCPPPSEILETREPPISVVNWSKKQIEEWAASHSISSEKVLRLDGELLNFLNGMRKSAPEFFFKFASKNLGLTELRDMMNLSYGLEALDL